jgi:hypothetical protein
MHGIICSCENLVEKHYSLQIKNNSNFNICCYFYLVWEGGDKGVIYPDTLISFYESELIYINAGEIFRTSRPVKSIIDWVSSLAKDTLSIYVFNQDILNAHSWEKIQREYKILLRYDLSIEDIRLLYNEHDVPEIPYPPDEQMKNMKMYPPYGTYNE